MADFENHKTDIELMNALRSGDTHSYSILVERYFSMVYTIAYGRLKNRETAEDLAQEVFLRIYLYLGEGRQPYHFAGWIVRITHNLITDWNRCGQSKSKLLPMISIEEIKTELTDEKRKDVRAEMDAQKKNDIVNEAIFRLPVEQREIVLLHYVEGLNQKEIAERLGVHPSTVGRQLNKSLEVLKDLLGPILQETAVSLRPPKKVILQTIAIIAASSILSTSAKASVLEAAGGKIWITSAAKLVTTKITAMGKIISLLQNLMTLIISGGKIMGTGKTVAAAVIAVTCVVGGIKYYNKPIEKNNPVSIPAVLPLINTQTLLMPEKEYILEGFQIKPSKAQGMSTSQIGRKFTGEGMDFLNLILNAYDTTKTRIVFNFAIPDKNYKYDITSKLLVGQNDDLKTITQKGIEAYFGLKVIKEKRNMDVYLLKSIPEFASRLDASASDNLNNSIRLNGTKINLKNGKLDANLLLKQQMKEGLEKKLESSMPSSNKGKVTVYSGNNPPDSNLKKDTAVYSNPNGIVCLGATLNNFARNLESNTGFLIIDETNTGDKRYNFNFECNLKNIEEVKKVLHDKYGLELKPDKRKIEMLIIDKKW